MKILPLFLLFFCQLGYAQHEFGVLTKEEMDMTQSVLDPDADATVLFDIGESQFRISSSGGFDIEFTRTKRIKVFSKEAASQGEIKIPYYQDGFGKSEIVSDIQAASYNIENGSLVKSTLDDSHIFTEAISERWNAKTFAIPNVKEGTILEYTYKLLTPFMYNLPDWEFQSDIPVQYSKYETHMIPFYEYVFLLQGASQFSEQKSYKEKGVTRQYASLEFSDMVYEFTMKDVPAFGDESFISSKNDYIIKIDFQLAQVNRPDGTKQEIITTWPELSNALLKHASFGKYMQQSEKYFGKNGPQDKIPTDLNERAQWVINQVKQSMTWNGHYGHYVSDPVKKVQLAKTGNIADINLYLAGALRSAGVQAVPVLISTRNHGRIKTDYPFESAFNAVVVQVTTPDGIFLADGTAKYLAYDQLPPATINGRGLLIAKDSEDWATLVPGQNSTEAIHLSIEVEEEALSFDYACVSSGYPASTYRSYQNDLEKLASLYAPAFEQIDHLKSEHFDMLTAPYRFSFSGTTEFETFGENIAISPFLHQVPNENPLKQKKRTHPVDLVYPVSHSYRSVINIPDGYVVESLPEPFQMNNSIAQISLFVNRDDDKIHIEGTYLFKKSIYSSSEYSRLKTYFQYVADKFNDPVILARP